KSQKLDDVCVLEDEEGLLTRTQFNLKTCYFFVPAQAFPWSFASLARTANPDGKFCFLEWYADLGGGRMKGAQHLLLRLVTS
ncbi:hypothetical protein ACQP3L_33810, partial [Escherichia coli]